MMRRGASVWRGNTDDFPFASVGMARLLREIIAATPGDLVAFWLVR